MSCLLANPFFLPGWRTGGGGICLPSRSLPVLLHKSHHPHNPWSWQPSAQEQSDFLISTLCSPNLLGGQAARLCCMSVRPQGAGRALESPRPNTSSELPLLEMLDHQAQPSHQHPLHPPGTAFEPLAVTFIQFWLCIWKRVPKSIQGEGLGRGKPWQSLQRLAFFLQYLLLVALP